MIMQAGSARNGDIAILQWSNYESGQDTVTLQGVDLAKMSVLWTDTFPATTSYSHIRYNIDDQGVVLTQYTDLSESLFVLDPATGLAFASVQLGQYEMVDSVQSGWIFTDDGRNLCARPVRNPATCQWQAPFLYLSSAQRDSYVFGGGRWTNTAGGVVDAATGQQANFGHDAGNGASYDSTVYYTGPSPDKIFRVACTYSTLVRADCTFQPWDTAKDTSIAPAFPASRADFTPSGNVFVAAVETSGATMTVTARSWPSGKLLWQSDQTCQYGSCGLSYATAMVTNDIYLLKLDTGCLVYTIATGQSQLSQVQGDFPYGPSYAFSGQRVMYLATGSRVIAYDGDSPDFAHLWQLGKAGSYVAQVSGGAHHIFAVSDSSYQLWVLQQ